MTISLDTRVRAGRDVLVSQVGDESVLLDLATEQYFGLDAIGRTMWERVTAAQNVGDAVHALLAEFDVDRDRLERDLTTLLNELATRRLVELTDGPQC